MTAISEIQHARFYIFKKQENCETFFYTKILTLCKKQDNLRYVLIYKKKDTLRYAIFMKNFKFFFPPQKV